MKDSKLLKTCRNLSGPYRITGGKFHLRDISPDDTGRMDAEDKPAAQEALRTGVLALSELQERLYAQDQWAVLFVFQAMDAAGKDGAIKHVMSGINPQGCQVCAFKVPTTEELDHDYLWRCTRHLPERGRIGIFNRSYYEEVLTVRVHPEILARQKMPPKLVTNKIWKERYRDIRNYEDYLTRNGVLIRKFFLHVSKKEQKKRFLERIKNEEKNWKFSAGDVSERDFWDDYQDAYEEMIRETATKDAPWYVIPADHKWFTRIVVAAAAVDALASLDLQFPKLNDQQLRDLKVAHRKLMNGDSRKK